VLRIAFGVISCLSLLGVGNLSEFWDLDGFVPTDRGVGLKPFLALYGLGNFGGRALFFGSFTAYLCMAVGFQSPWAVALSLAASITELSWNYFPLSGAYTTNQVMLFCLIWADCGSVWSVDAWLKRRRSDESAVSPALIAPLRLLRFQVALIYLNTGLRKLFVDQWRNGTAVYYVVNNNVFRRFPFHIPAGLEWCATLLTYFTLFWEIGFIFMILYGPTRRVALIVGVLLHLGMFAVIEIGFGVLLILASIVPGGSRPLLAFFGAAALIFGIVVLANADTSRLNGWLAATHRTGWLYAIYGGVLLLTAIIAPAFGGSRRARRRVAEPV